MYPINVITCTKIIDRPHVCCHAIGYKIIAIPYVSFNCDLANSQAVHQVNKKKPMKLDDIKKFAILKNEIGIRVRDQRNGAQVLLENENNPKAFAIPSLIVAIWLM